MESDISDIGKITISNKIQKGFLRFEYGPSQCLFVWKGDNGEAEGAYRCIQKLMEDYKVHFGKLSNCEAAWGKCAYIMISDILSPEQKYLIAEGIKSEGYTTVVERLPKQEYIYGKLNVDDGNGGMARRNH